MLSFFNCSKAKAKLLKRLLNLYSSFLFIALSFVNDINKILFIVKLSLKNPPELNSEGFILFTNNINDLVGLIVSGLLKVADRLINSLFNNDINKFIRDTNHFHDVLAIDLCFDFFVS